MEKLYIILGIIGGAIVIMGFAWGIMRFLFNLGAQFEAEKKRLDGVCEDVTSAHEKIRIIQPQVQAHDTAIQLLQKDVTYIREGIDEIKNAMTRDHSGGGK